ncbi:septum formation inhibitor MinC [Asticcacaulis sp. BYS171W]|uniref:Septum formation inhibitor MinC n=1 Tax=Asticcacaulis aquaticus TaxID=2984212 RepID=A0ABT5HSU4_9CAUL|nr:septum formation inhibitor MinC [Asticcacaulis aquaticus]MDC7682536.1 septum formation inhibitor MinC [Asticcacaulis aquaticus]
MNKLMRLFDRRVRGFRLVEAIGLALALGMIFWVCLSKVKEGQEVARLNDLNKDIAAQEEAIKSLKVKVAALEQPARIEALAKAYLGMKPVAPDREAKLDNLVEISRSVSRPEVVGKKTEVVAAPAVAEEVTAPVEPPVTKGAGQ